MFIFASEIINSIGNIIQSIDDNAFFIVFLISFSDIFTYLLFFWFSYSSIKLVKKANRSIKNKVVTFIIISFIISFSYSIILLLIGLFIDKNIIDLRFKNKNDKNNINSPIFYFYSLIHPIFIMLLLFCNS